MRERVCRRVRALYSPQRRQRDTQRVGDGAGHRPLECERVIHVPVVFGRHERIAVGPAHQPNRDSRGAAGATYAALQQSLHTQRRRHVWGVGRYPLEREGRRVRRDAQSRHARQCARELVAHSIDEILVRSLAQVDQWEHGDGAHRWGDDGLRSGDLLARNTLSQGVCDRGDRQYHDPDEQRTP